MLATWMWGWDSGRKIARTHVSWQSFFSLFSDVYVSASRQNFFRFELELHEISQCSGPKRV